MNKAANKIICKRALDDFCAGLSIPKIALKYDVKENTLRSWKKRHKWDNVKDEAKVDAVAVYKCVEGGALYEKLLVKVTQTTEQALEGIRVSVFMANHLLADIHKNREESKEEALLSKDLPEREKWERAKKAKNREIREQLFYLREVTHIMKEGAVVMAAIMPRADEEMAQKILEALQQLEQSKGPHLVTGT